MFSWAGDDRKTWWNLLLRIPKLPNRIVVAIPPKSDRLREKKRWRIPTRMSVMETFPSCLCTKRRGKISPARLRFCFFRGTSRVWIFCRLLLSHGDFGVPAVRTALLAPSFFFFVGLSSIIKFVTGWYGIALTLWWKVVCRALLNFWIYGLSHLCYILVKFAMNELFWRVISILLSCLAKAIFGISSLVEIFDGFC